MMNHRMQLNRLVMNNWDIVEMLYWMQLHMKRLVRDQRSCGNMMSDGLMNYCCCEKRKGHFKQEVNYEDNSYQG